jgi:predicted nucleotidyltransferase component of viral defense system
MIPKQIILAWATQAPWKFNAQIEQDLVICRALVEIFSDAFLAENLAFRGGTALNKLYLQPQPRYSEDIDLVQITAIPFGPLIDKIRTKLSFLGKPNIERKANNNTLTFRFDSEDEPVIRLKLKVETNCREHFSVLGYQKFPFEVNSRWFSGKCFVTTYKIEELLGTKLRALYQRRKGRDLFDLNRAIQKIENLDIEMLIECYKKYMIFVVGEPPSQKEFILNMESKMKDQLFLNDVFGIIAANEAFDFELAYKVVKDKILDRL